MSDTGFSLGRLRSWIREGKKQRRKASKSQRVQSSKMFEQLEGRQLFSVGVDVPVAIVPDVLMGQVATVTGLNGAEISAYDATTQRIFITGSLAGEAIIQVYDMSDPTAPSFVNNITLSSIGDTVQSVTAHDGIIATAVADNDAAHSGHVAFFDASTLTLLNNVNVGSLPDMITFTHDGLKVLVANEGEAANVDFTDNYDDQNQGSISIIDLSSGIAGATVLNLDFTAYDTQIAYLQNQGVRIFPGQLPSYDFEPEYISVSPDDGLAFVTLQEANAVAVIDLTTNTIKTIEALGTIDHSNGEPTIEQHVINNLPALLDGSSINLGGMSGLHYIGDVNGNARFITVPDRGPNGDVVNGNRQFLEPDYQAQVVTLELDSTTGEVTVISRLLLTRADGTTPITGLPNIPNVDEVPVDGDNNPLGYDAFGADMEGVVLDDDGTFWMVDEYRPAIYHFDATGVLINRFVPQGTADLANTANSTNIYTAGDFGDETLDTDLLNRQPNRGFEAVALDAVNNVLYAFIQTPLENPDSATSKASQVIRVVGIDTTTGLQVSEYVYLLEKPDYRSGGTVDKIGDATYIGDGKFLVVERDSATESTGKKMIFEMDLKGATNLLDMNAPQLLAGQTLEQHSADELAAIGIHTASKIKVANIPSLGYVAGDKVEGITMMGDQIVILNDNDFINGAPTVLGVISFGDGDKLDASDKDGDTINLQNYPVHGLFLPDAISSYTVAGVTYYVTANEGDDRGENVRLRDLADDGKLDQALLDELGYVSTSDRGLAENDKLGRISISSIDGDIDGDGDIDVLYTYGTRSFSIFDQYGNLVYNSGSDLESIVATYEPELFNADDGDPGEIDTRSDAKGPEAEGVTIGYIDGKPYAFVCMERGPGGFVMYDISDPSAPRFVQYLRHDGDISPEGILFISAEDSPNGESMLILTNEISYSMTVYQGFDPNITYTAGSNRQEVTVRQNGDDLELLANGVVVHSQPVSSVYSVAIDTASNTSELDITIDFASGGSFGFNGDFTIDGASRYLDDLTLIGTNGNDTVDITAGSWDIQFLTDDADLYLTVTNFDGLNIQTGAGDDEVYIDGLTLQQGITIQTGDDNDIVELSNLSAKNNVTINTGNGDNTASVYDSSFQHDLTLVGGDDVDTLAIDTVSAQGNIMLNGGGGNDLLSALAATTNRRLTMVGEDGNDDLRLKDVTTRSGLTLNGGAGDDTMVAALVSSRSTILEGGSGTNSLVRDNTLTSRVRLRNFASSSINSNLANLLLDDDLNHVIDDII